MEAMPILIGTAVSVIPFAGTPAERTANFASHKFVNQPYDGVSCERCGTELHNESATYECGVDLPYQAEILFGDGTTKIHPLPLGFTWGDIENIERKYQ